MTTTPTPTVTADLTHVLEDGDDMPGCLPDLWWAALYASDTDNADWPTMTLDELIIAVARTIERHSVETLAYLAADAREAFAGGRWFGQTGPNPLRDRCREAVVYGLSISTAVALRRTKAVPA
ncbi:hypothetical protein [Hamadaea tsunoensis]|uniref:hypothetical protein n=1 Tax=Hamadaea tsunoensis TaxID=53368 RepID=UPI0004142185|nr:hypothetical protein [Hamadaea tsunoensis]